MITSAEQLCRLVGIPFSSEQLAAITAPLEPGVIVAGAGTGKTTVMAARVVWLVGTGAVRADQVLGLTFTRKAAQELAVRVRASLATAGLAPSGDQEPVPEQTMLTYDAFAGQLVEEYGALLGTDPPRRLLVDASRFQLAARVVASAAGPFQHLARWRPGTMAERLLGLDAELSSHLVDPDRVRRHAVGHLADLEAAPVKRGGLPYAAISAAAQTAHERVELLDLVEEYRRLKRTAGVAEFSDQMATASQLVDTAPLVGQRLREKFRVVLLDEYQDTSSAQAQLLRALFSGADPDTGRGHPVTAVGDPFQAIYGWRGAAASNIDRFPSHFPRSTGDPAATHPLSINRRSGPEILDGANALAATLHEQPGQGFRLKAAPKSEGSSIEVGRFLGWPDEVAWLVSDIQRSREMGHPWRDHAVLVRRNADAGALFAAFREADVPCEIVGLGGLMWVPEVADLVSILRLVHDVASNPDLIRLLTGPRWAIGRGDLVTLARRAAELAGAPASDATAETPREHLERLLEDTADGEPPCLLDAVESPGPGPWAPGSLERFRELARELASYRRHAHEPVLDLAHRIVAGTGLQVELAVTQDRRRRGGGRQLSAFLRTVSDHVEAADDSSLPGVLAWLDAEAQHGQGLEQAPVAADDAVVLLTMHRSKGLEWPVVYLPAMVDGVFPNDRVSDNWLRSAASLPAPLRGDADSIPQLGPPSQETLQYHADELKGSARKAEDRLAYVAVTRARRRLVATGHWWNPETARPRKASDYLEALWPHAATVVEDSPPPGRDEVHPCPAEGNDLPWPWRPDPAAVAEVRAAAAMVLAPPPGPRPCADDEATVAAWDREIDFLVSEASDHRAAVQEVEVPMALSVTQAVQARSNPDSLAEDLLRPMPVAPSAAARLGSAFHDWVARRCRHHGFLLDDDAPDPAAPASADDLAALQTAFAEGQFGDRDPVRVEHPVTWLLDDGRQLRGRIDAVHRGLDHENCDWVIVDWKTGAAEQADPWQLAFYRQAWAAEQGCDVDRVRAAFHWVRTDTLQWCDNLPAGEDLVRRWRHHLASAEPRRENGR